MAEKMKRLPDSELEIMLAVWSAEGGVSSAYIQERIKERRGWSLQTLLTVLARLVEKGFLSIEKQGRHNLYHAVIGEEAYKQEEGRSVLERVYGNSFSNLVSALYQGKAISRDDLKELRQFIDDLEES